MAGRLLRKTYPGVESEHHLLITLHMIFMCLIVWMIWSQEIISRFSGDETEGFHMVSFTELSVVWKWFFIFFCRIMICKSVTYCLFILGWWYGVVDHLESCTRNEDHCICHDNGEWFIFCTYISGWLINRSDLYGFVIYKYFRLWFFAC